MAKKPTSKNPTFFDGAIITWRFGSAGPTPPQPLYLDLPSSYIDGTGIELHGVITATVVPVPGGLVLLGTGLAGLLGYGRRKQKIG